NPPSNHNPESLRENDKLFPICSHTIKRPALRLFGVFGVFSGSLFPALLSPSPTLPSPTLLPVLLCRSNGARIVTCASTINIAPLTGLARDGPSLLTLMDS